ncbi:MAG: hypothetical protein WCT42_00390 [Candidatus Paceibacterota bacterium]
MNNFQKYLPSKKFISIVFIIVILIALFFGIKEIISIFKNKKTSNGEPIKMTIGGIIQKDSNKNGIADWEEYLWGLDPNKNGPENKEFILAKKKTLEQNGVISMDDDSKQITDNEILSREFFATIISLQQTGEISQESLDSVAQAVGQKIEATPIPDIYKSDMLTIENDSALANQKYHEAISNLINSYENADIGTELILVAEGLKTQDPQALYAAKTVAVAYRSFGNDLTKIAVPRSLTQTHLSLANNYEKTAQSIEGLAKMLNDPTIGMSSIINYKKYSDAIATDLEKLSNILQ